MRRKHRLDLGAECDHVTEVEIDACKMKHVHTHQTFIVTKGTMKKEGNGWNYHFWWHKTCSSSFSPVAMPVDVMAEAQSLPLEQRRGKGISMRVLVTKFFASASSRFHIPTTS